MFMCMRVPGVYIDVSMYIHSCIPMIHTLIPIYIRTYVHVHTNMYI